MFIFSKKVSPHFSWRWSFLTFGSIGFMWVFVWIYFYKEIRVSVEVDDLIFATKVMNRDFSFIMA
jgi:hypothetical protein